MITETDLIKKIKELKQIRPRSEWVVLCKNQILEEQEMFGVRPQTFLAFLKMAFKLIFKPALKPALATAMAFGIVFGVFGFAQNALPGELLYSVKKLTEKTQAVFVSEQEKPYFQFELANKRIQELNKIAETNQANKLAPAIKEYQASVSKAVENLTQIKEPEKNPEIVKQVVLQSEKLTEKKQEVETLGVVFDNTEEQLEDSANQLIERMIAVWEREPLNEKQAEYLKQAKEFYEQEEYYQASQELEKVYINQ